MKAVVQRVKKTTLKVNGELISQIDGGLVVYFGVEKGDTEEKVHYLAKKIANLRIFEDDNKKMNLSVKDVKGEILAVSQFTLLADLSHGNRPSFSNAEIPERANELYRLFMEKLAENGVSIKQGLFGEDMKIEQFNDGPVTVIYEI